jgi:hypothetical protein
MVTSLSIGRGGLGRFGNQMFTIAGVIGIAEKSGQPFGFPEWKNYDNALFGGTVDNMNEFFENPLPSINGQQFQEYGYFWGYRDVYLPSGDWSIDAHLQSGKFFEHSIGKVRHYFRMKDEPEQNDYVAIHYRAGDYIDNPDAYHPRCGKEYYEEAVNRFSEDDFFNVYSDDPDAAYEIFKTILPVERFFVEAGNSYISDFAYLKKCKSFIIANSSFSAMAAHLGEHPDKKVIAPKRWFGAQANGMPTEDIYDKNWIVI